MRYNSTQSLGGDKGVHAFPKNISQKVNKRAQLEFELIYYDVVVQHLSHSATETVSSPAITVTIVQKYVQNYFKQINMPLSIADLFNRYYLGRSEPGSHGKKELTNFNNMSTILGLFDAQKLRNCIHYTFVFTFFV